MAVVFDSATSASEETGDGVISLTHTSAGSNRAVFAGAIGVVAGGTTSTSTTYGGTGMTERWDFGFAGPNAVNAGYSLTGQATGAQTVTNTLATATPLQHGLGVISMTGVDQTTEVGTPATAEGTTSPATVTVGSVGADDLVVDNGFVNAQPPTVGADQTSRYIQDIGGGGDSLMGSTQPGTAGGVMSWTFTNETWALGAIAFKPVAGGAVFTKMVGGYGPGMALAGYGGGLAA